jgi:hypothetical protein
MHRTELEMMTVWRPTKDERDALAAGALVMLHVLGTIHPPVYLSVETGVHEVAGGVHLLIDNSQMRCGMAIEKLPPHHVWTQDKERVTCGGCNG